MKLPELRELAKQLGLRGISGMRKNALIDTIEAARSGGEPPAGVSVRPVAKASASKTESERSAENGPLPPTESAAQTTTVSDAKLDADEVRGREPQGSAKGQVGDLFDALGIDEGVGRRSRADRAERSDRAEHTVADDESVIINRRRHRSGDSHTRGRGRDERDDRSRERDRGSRDHSKVRDLDDILAALPARENRPTRNKRNRDEHERDYRHNSYDRHDHEGRADRSGRDDRRGRKDRRSNRDYEARESRDDFRNEDLVPVAGIVDVLDSYAFIRTSGYLPGPNDVYVSIGQVKKYGLRKGDAVQGTTRPPREGERRNQRQKFMPLQSIETVNGMSVEEAIERPHFNKLTPLYPQERMRMETTSNQITGRLIDIVAPIGKGQRGLIVSPPKAGKTITLQNIANAIAKNNPEVHLMVVLVDERPEEVTDMERTVQGEVISSTFDRPAADHTTVAELAIERAKRLVELGQDVVVLLDSMTRLARAYNIAAPASGHILSGGVDAQALYPPKRFFGAARNIENGGSLTIISSALVETGSKMDEVIFEEFKGTGNMELRLSRELADKRMFPAIDINASGTRREELITAPDELAVVYRLRRLLGGMEIEQAYQTLVPRLKKTPTNRDFLGAITQTMLGQQK
ncbi:Transcription termination factor rho [Bifidobacterium actinocoloniiforme DSM 22766]|uniref:Transcription termination factor Rho n=2 Tax=Bifidobacterium actinocoloniiforme TaxID=638619 RepID=A0A086YVW1_9BIFI|nr:Transcription termination factor rho [Bifidobacterium actinocoloniiforme DSM 22766]